MSLKRWTDDDIDFMMKNHKKMSYKEIANVLGHPEKSTAVKLSELGLTKKRNDWSEKEINFLKSNYLTMMYSDMSKVLNRSEGAIRAKCFDLNLVKKDAWSDEEINYLKNNYSELSHQEIANHLNRTENSVHLKANKLGLKKYPYYCNYKFFENIDTEDKAYWFGFICADGWISVDQKTNSGVVGIELQVGDIDHIKKFNKSIGGNYRITTRTRTNTLDNRLISSEECCIRVFSRTMVSDLLNHGITPNKSYDLNFPIISDEMLPHFIRGYFDGDGSIYYHIDQHGKYRTNCTFTSISKQFLEVLRQKLFENDINSYIYTTKECYSNFCEAYELRIGNSESVEKFLDYIYKSANIYLDRKYKRYINRP